MTDPKTCPECGAELVSASSTGHGDTRVRVFACGSYYMEVEWDKWQVLETGEACEY